MSGDRELCNVHPGSGDGNADCDWPDINPNSDSRRKRLLPMPGQHMCSAEQRRVFRRLRPRAASGVFGHWRLRDVYAYADRDSHSNRRSERLLPV